MRKFLILVLPIAVLALGVTYAYFSTNLNIGNRTAPNVVETGTLDWNVYLAHEWWDTPDIRDYIWVPGTDILIPEDWLYDVGNATIFKNGDTITIELSNVYPGYVAVAHFVFVNDGTIPSKLDSVNISIVDPNGVANGTIVAVHLWGRATFNDLPWTTKPVRGWLDYRIITYLPDLSEYLEFALKWFDPVFLPGDYIAFCKPPNATNVTVNFTLIDPRVPPEIVSMLNNTDSFALFFPPKEFLLESEMPQNAKLKFNLTLRFTQYNAPVSPLPLPPPIIE